MDKHKQSDLSSSRNPGLKVPEWMLVPPYLKEYIASNYQSVDHDVSQFLDSVNDLFEDPDMRALTGIYRSKLNSFVTREGAKPYGMTNVNIVGTYQIGAVPPHDKLDQAAKRWEGQRLYSQAVAVGFNKTAKAMGFQYSPDGKYKTTQDALIAIEMESMSSKGPYDGGTRTTAFESEEKNLQGALTYKPIPEDVLQIYLDALVTRREQIAPFINRRLKFEPRRFNEIIASRGLKSTFRGGLNATGNSTLTYSQLHYTKWLFSHLKPLSFMDIDEAHFFDRLAVEATIRLPLATSRSKILLSLRAKLEQKYTQDGKSWKFVSRTENDITVKRMITVDEWITKVNLELFEDKRLWIHDIMAYPHGLKFSLMGNLERDQGSPFKYEHDTGFVKATTEQKERKYRMVIPVNCFVQSWLQIAGSHQIDQAPKFPSRIGLQDPETNQKRMSQEIVEAWQSGTYLDNLDYSAFDSTIVDQLSHPCSLMYASLYDDPMIKEVFSFLGVWSMYKTMILARPVNYDHNIWDAFPSRRINKIKGEATYGKSKVAAGTKNAMLKRELEDQVTRGSEYDYVAVAVFINHCWEPSGIYFTNAQESDINATVSEHVVPRLVVTHPEVAAHPELVQAMNQLITAGLIKSQVSGDDITMRIPRIFVQVLGRDKVLEIYEWAYDKIHWIFNSAKMSKVLYEVNTAEGPFYAPPVEFLQTLYLQNGADTKFEAHKKPMRAITSLGYAERDPDIPPIMQYTSIDGRFNSGVGDCDFDLQFTANMIVHTGQALFDLVTKYHYRPPKAASTLKMQQEAAFNYNAKCETSVSKLLGLDDYLGYVMKYGDDFISELTRHCVMLMPDKAGDLINDVAKELETRAPHRRGMEDSMLQALTPEERQYLLGSKREGDSIGYKPVTTKLVKLIDTLVPISATELPEIKETNAGASLNDLSDAERAYEEQQRDEQVD